MLRGQELRCNSEVNQEEEGFQGAHFLHLPSPSLTTTIFPANDKWKVGVEGGRWVLAKRVSHLLLSEPASQVYAIPVHSGKTKCIKFGFRC